MKKLFVTTIMAGAIAATASFAPAQTILTENFDGYADQAAFAAVWSIGSTGVTLGTDGGHSGSNYARHPLTAVRQGRTFTPTTPSNSAPMVVDFWIRVPGLQSRTMFGVGAVSGSTVSAVVEFGNYNDPAGAGWFARLVGGTPVPAGFQHLGGTRPENAWTNLKFIIKSRDVDFYENGVKLGTISRTATDFGALSGVYIGASVTATQVADFDDIVISTTSNVNDWNLY